MKFEEIPEIWSSVQAEIRECPDCSVETIELVEGTATSYELCEPHRQQVYREYHLEQNESRGRRVEGWDVDGISRALSEGEDTWEALESLRRLAAADPDAIRPLRDQLFDFVEEEVRDDSPGSSHVYKYEDGVGLLATSDDPTLDRLHEYLGDDDSDVRGFGHSALEMTAWFAPERVFDEDVVQLCRMLREGEERPALRALDVLVPLSKARPEQMAGQLTLDSAARYLDGEHQRDFKTAVILGNLSSADPAFASSHESRLEEMLSDDDPRVRGGGAIALGLAGEIGREEALEHVRALFDPSRYSETYVREAAAALGVLGDDSDAELLEYRVVRYPYLETKLVIDDAIERLRG